MSNDAKRWGIGKNDIDRDNKLISRDPSNSSYIPSGKEETDFSKSNIIRKVISVILAGIILLIFNFLSKNIFSDYAREPIYLIISLLITVIAYFVFDSVLRKKLK